MSFFTKIIGREGEDRAAKFLKKQGHRIFERNYRTWNREIDLIALHEGMTVFIEVKTRTNDAYGLPQHSAWRRCHGWLFRNLPSMFGSRVV